MSTIVKRKTSSYAALLCAEKVVEWWECDRLLNQRPTLTVWVIGRRRFDSRDGSLLTEKSLIEDTRRRVFRSDKF
jgi:hypothetical protein